MARRELVVTAAAAAGGAVWGLVMAWVAWRFEGAEIVLLQAWILVACWAVGRLQGRARFGLLAGLTLCAAALWTYEWAPSWGFESFLVAHHTPRGVARAIADQRDNHDIVLWSEIVFGALCGLGGSLSAHPDPLRRMASAATLALALGIDLVIFQRYYGAYDTGAAGITAFVCAGVGVLSVGALTRRWVALAVMLGALAAFGGAVLENLEYDQRPQIAVIR
jgi:hypothetical protein